MRPTPKRISSSQSLIAPIYVASRAPLAAPLALVVVCLAVGLASARHSDESGPVDALLQVGRYEQAEAVARSALESARGSTGDRSAETLSATDDLVRALVANGRAALETTLTLARGNLRDREASGLGASTHVVTLDNLADVLVAWARYDEAIATATRAVAIAESERASALAETLDRLGIAQAGAGRYQEALKTFERSLRIKKATLSASDVAIARTLEEIGFVRQRSGDYTASAEPLRQAEALQRAADPSHPAYVRTLNLMADQRWFEGDLAESKAMSERALALAEAALRPEHPLVASTLATLAGTLSDLGDLDRALALKRRAHGISERDLGPLHYTTAEYLHGLGLAELRAGDYPNARRHVQQALDTFEAHYGHWHEYVATSLHVLALVDAAIGDYPRAQAEQARVIAIHTRVGGANHPYVAVALVELARIHAEQGRPERALPLLQRALAIRERRLGPGHRDVALTLADLAATRSDLGQRTQSEALVARAVRIWEQLDAPDAPEYATVLTLYGRLQASRGVPASAVDYYERARAIRRRVFGLTHPLVAEVDAGLAAAQAALAEPTAALETAARAEATGRDHLRLMLRSLPERQALAYAASRPRGLDLMVSLAASMAEAAEPALDATIRNRGLVLDEIAARGATADPADQDLSALRGQLRSAQQRLANLTVRGPEQLPAERYRALLDEARDESERIEQLLASRSLPFSAERSRSLVSLEQVRQALEPGSALVSFVRFNRTRVERSANEPKPATVTTIPSYLAFVVRYSGSVVVVPLGTARWIDRVVEQWRTDIAAEALTAGTVTEGAPRPSAQASGTALRRAIWDPLAPALGDTGRLFVVPDGLLSLVPLAALPIGTRSYLVERGPVIHYLSAERDLITSDDHAVNRGLLAIGGPSFGRVAAVASEQGRPASSACNDSLGNIAFPPLAGTLREVQDLSRIWNANGQPGAESAQVLAGTAASESAFKAAAPRHRVLHLATHGFFLDGTCGPGLSGTRGVGGLARATSKSVLDNPLLLSGLALAGANRRAQARPDQDDGILTAEEVASLDLSGTEWAVLSACDTGVGEIKAGEGVFGLRRAFQVAGARTVIMSLWSVDDQSTRAWMRALYEGRFQRHLSTADAVHQASLSVLRDRRARGLSTHPFFWAAFVAAGDWR